MPPRPLRRPATGQPETDRALRAVVDAVNEIGGNALLRGRILTVEDVNATNTDDHITLAAVTIKKLKHGLGRRLLGFVVVDSITTGTPAAVARVQTDGTNTADETTDLWLKANIACRVKVLVY